MSRYNKLISPSEDEEKTYQPPEPEIQIQPRSALPSSEILDEEDVENLARIKKFCNIMLITSPIIPVLSWFIDPFHFVFYQALIIFVMQIYVAISGYRAIKADHYNRLEYFKKIVHAFYVYYLISLVMNEIAAIFVSSGHNFKNCGTFVNNRVCVNRTGLMTTQLVTLLFSPGLDFAVWIFYRYLLTVINDCKVGFTRRRL
ncbi:hypothetical protein SteCoe_17724 [Stentor coeruleus]|uniref:Uncharacterized protein n=1 Tax=Stentor coeruleus TaxID=5963 RepID=A0A1R2BYA7_9CILI|nr:hypothetical protein SteCoe_17724 [Stentor coeruleus]